tara:strand:- start:484 stop:1431 length:948 start_codon:yes stop_codon:yes gene_type:complete
MDGFCLDDVLNSMMAPKARGSHSPRWRCAVPSPLRRSSSQSDYHVDAEADDHPPMVYTFEQEQNRIDNTEFSHTLPHTRSYRNLERALAHWAVKTPPPFAELLRYSYKDQSLNLKRDDHLLAVYVHHVSRRKQDNNMSYRDLSCLISFYNKNGNAMVPSQLRICIIRKAVQDLRMRDPTYTPTSQVTTREHSLVSQAMEILDYQPFAQDDAGFPMRSLLGSAGENVRALVKAKARELLAAVPPSSSVCMSTIAKWAVWRVCVADLAMGKMLPQLSPTNHAQHSKWLKKLGCYIEKKKRKRGTAEEGADAKYKKRM